MLAWAALKVRGKAAELSPARSMGLNPRQIDRLLDLRHTSTIPQLEQALTVCGKRVEVETRTLEAA